MKKDVIAAVVVGFILGGLVAVAAVNLPAIFKSQTLSKTEQIVQDITPQPTPSVTETASYLEVAEPKDESIVEEKELKIAGKTKAGDAVLVESETDISAADVEDDGTFTTNLTLAEGGNVITIHSVNENSEESKSITVYYTSDKL